MNDGYDGLKQIIWAHGRKALNPRRTLRLLQ